MVTPLLHNLLLSIIFALLFISGCLGNAETDNPDLPDITQQDLGELQQDDPSLIVVDTMESEPVPTCPDGWNEQIRLQNPRINTEEREFFFPECEEVENFLVASRSQRFLLTLKNIPTGSYTQIASMDGTILASGWALSTTLQLPFEITTTGEHRVFTRRPNGMRSGTYSAVTECVAGCSLKATRYPIVLVHGIEPSATGYFDSFTYFFNIKDHLEEMGYRVFTPIIEPHTSHEARRDQLSEVLGGIMAETQASKLHLIGHGQGGLDIRTLVSTPDNTAWIASLTTIATPHRGLNNPYSGAPFITDVSTAYMTGDFIELYPDSDEIPGFSWAGASCLPLDHTCQNDYNGEILTALLIGSYTVTRSSHSNDEFSGANDGFVPVSSAVWGEFLGVLSADHYDQIGHIAGYRVGSFDTNNFFETEAERLGTLEISQEE